MRVTKSVVQKRSNIDKKGDKIVPIDGFGIDKEVIMSGKNPADIPEYEIDKLLDEKETIEGDPFAIDEIRETTMAESPFSLKNFNTPEKIRRWLDDYRNRKSAV